MIEKWTEYYSNEQIKQIQKIEIESLKYFDEICKKIGVEYFLYGGSLLGAIKYNGFVPWDDDLDLGMMREDYEKLIKDAPALLTEKYELQHPKINKYYPFPYIKFRRTDTALIEYPLRKVKINQGVYFDIYPIDCLPENDDEYIKQKQDMDRIVSKFQIRQNVQINVKINSVKSVIQYLFRMMQRLVYGCVPRRYFIRKMDSIMTRYNGICTRRYGNLFFPKPVNYFDGIEPLQKVKFEELMVNIPSGYEVNLRNRYGDISALPPKNQRVGHIPYILKLKMEDHE